MEDNKHYIRLNEGTYALERAEWDADSEKLATEYSDGVGLKIFTEGDYEGGCDYAFACGGHWYLY